MVGFGMITALGPAVQKYCLPQKLVFLKHGLRAKPWGYFQIPKWCHEILKKYAPRKNNFHSFQFQKVINRTL